MKRRIESVEDLMSLAHARVRVFEIRAHLGEDGWCPTGHICYLSWRLASRAMTNMVLEGVSWRRLTIVRTKLFIGDIEEYAQMEMPPVSSRRFEEYMFGRGRKKERWYARVKRAERGLSLVGC